MEFFGVGFHQILFIMIIALIVFGPEKLPGIARQAGRYVNDLRRLTQEARGEIQSLTKDLDLRDDLASVKADLLDLKNDLTSTGSDLMKDFQEVKKQVDLRDEAGNLMGQQREQYMVQVQDVPSENPGEPDAIRVEETIRRETIIQEAVENEPAYGTQTLELNSSTAASDEFNSYTPGVIRPARPLVQPAVPVSPFSLDPQSGSGNFSGGEEAVPLPVNSEVFAASIIDPARPSTNGVHQDNDKLEQIELELRLMENRWQDDRRELYNRVEDIERQFLERLERIEQAVSARYEEAQQA